MQRLQRLVLKCVPSAGLPYGFYLASLCSIALPPDVAAASLGPLSQAVLLRELCLVSMPDALALEGYPWAGRAAPTQAEAQAAELNVIEWAGRQPQLRRVAIARGGPGWRRQQAHAAPFAAAAQRARLANPMLSVELFDFSLYRELAAGAAGRLATPSS